MISTICWTLPRPSKSKYPGSFPLYFEQNLIQILGYPEKILHPFGGMAEYGDRCDMRPEVKPDFLCDAHDLPFADETYDLVVLDPPYSDEESADIYDTGPLKPAKYLAEAVRVCKEGGWVVVYTDKEPRRPPRCNHNMRIMVSLRMELRKVRHLQRYRHPWVDFIVAHVFRRVPVTEAEYDSALAKVEEALVALEVKGEDGIIKARSLLYEVQDVLG